MARCGCQYRVNPHYRFQYVVVSGYSLRLVQRHRDIYEKSERGAFDVEKSYTQIPIFIQDCGMLMPPHKGQWSLNLIAISSRAPTATTKHKRILARNGRVHFNLNMRFNANSLGVPFY